MTTYMILAEMLLQKALRCTFLLWVTAAYLGCDRISEVAHLVGLGHHVFQLVISRNQVVHHAGQVRLEVTNTLDGHVRLVECLFAVLFLRSSSST